MNLKKIREILNDGQYEGFLHMINGESCFVTGDAGTGKSHLVRTFIEYMSKKKKIAICAPTGIAALNVGGVTCHSFFKIPITPGKLLPTPTSAPKEVIAADIIIIDEISMARFDIFDYMMYCVGLANIMRRKNNKSLIQVIVVGDFFQLPPVITEEDRELFKEAYKKDVGAGYAFFSKFWSKLNFTPIVLKQVVRQDNAEFSKALTMARYGDKRCLRYFELNQSLDRQLHAITLASTNKVADTINSEKLSKIKTKPFKLIGDTIDEFPSTDKVVNDEITLKVGARVLLCVNMSEMGKSGELESLYKNGDLGEVVDIHLDNNGEIDKIIVKKDFDNKIVEVEKYTWNKLKYVTETVEIDGEVSTQLVEKIVGSFIQFPIKLGWAITIHKSQGQTYDAVNLFPKSWDYGQLYVALSRCKRMETTYLEEPILPYYLKSNPEVIKFYNYLESQVALRMKNN